MSKLKLCSMVEGMIAELRHKIECSVPNEGCFQTVYSEFKNTDEELCLTDVMLKFQSIPEYLPNYETDRWLQLVGYKLPCPFKSTIVVFKGSKEEALRYLCGEEVVDKIVSGIVKLDYNLQDF